MMQRIVLMTKSLALVASFCWCGAVAAQQPGDDAPPTVVRETNPAVRAALEWPRAEPDPALRAVLALVDLGRPDLAKPILEELHNRGLTEPQRAGLVEQFGSYRMLQLASQADLAPVGGEFAESCMSAAAAASSDPQRLEVLIQQLADPSRDVRLAARADLSVSGRAGTVALLEAMARESDPQQRARLAATAARMEPVVVGPLLAMLETSDPALRAEVGRLLVALGAPQAAGLLMTRPAEAERQLLDSLEQYRRGALPFVRDALVRVELWQWDDQSKTLASALYPAEDARILWMARLANRLSQLRPDNRAYRKQALVLALEAAGLMERAHPDGESGSSANAHLQSVDGELLSEVLAESLKRDFAHAAVAAADELGRRGDARVLLSPDARPSPLVDALIHPGRRLRFAALGAIMALDPASPYPGSSRVPKALAYYSGSRGKRRGLVAMPTLAAATDVAGKLAHAGLRGEATNRGSEVARLAAQMSDLELVLLDMDIQASGVRQVLYELRITPASGHTPVALLAADGRLEAAHRLAGEHQRVLAVPRPHSAEAVAQIADRLLAIAEGDAVSADERAAQAEQAAQWITYLQERGRTFYALPRGAALENGLRRITAPAD